MQNSQKLAQETIIRCVSSIHLMQTTQVFSKDASFQTFGLSLQE